MIIIRFQGGLGNQMFQYALYLELKYIGKSVKADITTYMTDKDLRKFKLRDVFNVDVDIADKKEIYELAGGEKNYIGGFIRKYLRRKTYFKEEQLNDYQVIASLEDAYLDGYWQNEKFFPHVKKILKEKYIFMQQSIKTNNLYAMIQKEQSVSIHIRMGDYLVYNDVYGEICTKEYYQNAIEYIMEKIDSPIFFVFSDEPEKAKDFLGNRKAIYVEKQEDDWCDMYLMSKCKHNIIANSTFSWWAAWLNKNYNKQIISPKKWTNNSSDSPACKGWIIL